MGITLLFRRRSFNLRDQQILEIGLNLLKSEIARLILLLLMLLAILPSYSIQIPR